VALITERRRIGRQRALLFAQEGARVAIADITRDGRATEERSVNAVGMPFRARRPGAIAEIRQWWAPRSPFSAASFFFHNAGAGPAA
jgi:NAD(P)-dependent dehydrogenase (short-subunit alcohol dehydrogenase family)